LSSWLLRDVAVEGRVVDCRLENRRIAALGPDLRALAGDEILAAHGGALLPGLADHHIHLLATAALANSVDLAGGSDLSVLKDQPGTGWLRVVGAGVELRRQDVDRARDDRPVRVQHRGGALWTLNSAAIALLGTWLGPDERATGQLWRADERLRQLLRKVAGPISPPDLRALGRRLAAHGITHLTEATPDLSTDTVALLRQELPQHVMSMGMYGDGPRKLLIPDHVPVLLDDLIDRVRTSHGTGRPVAIHAVTQSALALAIAALGEVGSIAGDRIEHAAVCDDSAADRLAELDVTVVTQPTLMARHGRAYKHDAEVADRPFLWRYASLLAAGVRVAVSSDSPYGDPDPWHTIQAAANREDEQVAPAVALHSLLADPHDPAGPARKLVPGAPADLCLLRESLSCALERAERLGTGSVRATFVAGAAIYLSEGANGRG
jgi:predicted amidohydrolase YtcJ